MCEWQEKSYYYSQIGPHFGLAEDYDRFVLGLAGSFWALIAILMRGVPGAVHYIATQLRDVLVGLEKSPTVISFFNALWLLHIAASEEGILDEYNYARSFINDRGGICGELLYQPPGGFGEIWKEANWLTCVESPEIQVPELGIFKEQCGKSPLNDSQRRLESVYLALDALLDEETWLQWSPRLLRLLHV